MRRNEDCPRGLYLWSKGEEQHDWRITTCLKVFHKSQMFEASKATTTPFLTTMTLDCFWNHCSRKTRNFETVPRCNTTGKETAVDKYDAVMIIDSFRKGQAPGIWRDFYPSGYYPISHNSILFALADLTQCPAIPVDTRLSRGTTRFRLRVGKKVGPGCTYITCVTTVRWSMGRSSRQDWDFGIWLIINISWAKNNWHYITIVDVLEA